MSDIQDTAWRLQRVASRAGKRRDLARALKDTGAKGATVLLVGLEELRDDCWTVLVDAGVRLERADDVAGAMSALTARPDPGGDRRARYAPNHWCRRFAAGPNWRRPTSLWRPRWTHSMSCELRSTLERTT